jgi:2-polyprenyl-6-methoxyphenol hydroxylase-like FAD-dependent oxidoreductase
MDADVIIAGAGPTGPMLASELRLAGADALLIRPDAHIAWAATIGEPAETAALALREALSCWFGKPLKGHHDQP